VALGVVCAGARRPSRPPPFGRVVPPPPHDRGAPRRVPRAAGVERPPGGGAGVPRARRAPGARGGPPADAPPAAHRGGGQFCATGDSPVSPRRGLDGDRWGLAPPRGAGPGPGGPLSGRAGAPAVGGGLAHVAVVGEILFGGIAGSTTADVAVLAALLLPAMEREGYRRAEAVAIVSAAAAMGILVPPCLLMVLLATIANLSVTAL